SFRDHLLTEMEYLQRVRDIRDHIASHGADDVPARLANKDIAQAYYRIALEQLKALGVSPDDRETAADIALMIEDAINSKVVVDWRLKDDVKNRMRANIDDGFFELSQQGKITLDWNVIDEIAEQAAKVAQSRLP